MTSWNVSALKPTALGNLWRKSHEESAVRAFPSLVASSPTNENSEVYANGIPSLIARRTVDCVIDGNANRARNEVLEDVRIVGEPNKTCDSRFTNSCGHYDEYRSGL